MYILFIHVDARSMTAFTHLQVHKGCGHLRPDIDSP